MFLDSPLIVRSVCAGSHPTTTHHPPPAYPSQMKLALAISFAAAAVARAADPVNVLLCIEAYCPGCQQFTVDDLIPTYEALGSDVMNVTVVPFGNAHITDEDARTMTCQHGEDECSGNSYEQCAISLYPDPTDHLSYIGCFDKISGVMAVDKAFETCATQQGLDWDGISACHDDADQSWELQVSFSSVCLKATIMAT